MYFGRPLPPQVHSSNQTWEFRINKHDQTCGFYIVLLTELLTKCSNGSFRTQKSRSNDWGADASRSPVRAVWECHYRRGVVHNSTQDRGDNRRKGLIWHKRWNTHSNAHLNTSAMSSIFVFLLLCLNVLDGLPRLMRCAICIGWMQAFHAAVSHRWVNSEAQRMLAEQGSWSQDIVKLWFKFHIGGKGKMTLPTRFHHGASSVRQSLAYHWRSVIKLGPSSNDAELFPHAWATRCCDDCAAFQWGLQRSAGVKSWDVRLLSLHMAGGLEMPLVRPQARHWQMVVFPLLAPFGCWGSRDLTLGIIGVGGGRVNW
jgi:hypothetical protein